MLTNNNVFIQNLNNDEESDYEQKLDLVIISYEFECVFHNLREVVPREVYPITHIYLSAHNHMCPNVLTMRRANIVASSTRNYGGSYCIQVCFSFIEHKSLAIICNLDNILLRVDLTQYLVLNIIN